MDILVVLEDNNGKLHRMSKEAIVAAQKIGGSVSALAIGKNSFNFEAESLGVSECGAGGVTKSET